MNPPPKRGRPALSADTKRKMLSIKVAPEIIDYLRSTGCGTATVENLIKRSISFRDWLKSQRT